MKVIYVAGPFRADTSWEMEQNVRRAEEVALELWKLGAAVICPHSNTRFYQGEADDQVWLDGDIEILKRCDAVYMLPDWTESVGASEEHKVAVESMKKTLYTMDQAKDYITDFSSKLSNLLDQEDERAGDLRAL
jgi:predicted mannosyl-3-phosphoglycerate phosphatase (HAD superfamily)